MRIAISLRFAASSLSILRALAIPGWTRLRLQPNILSRQRRGTTAVFSMNQNEDLDSEPAIAVEAQILRSRLQRFLAALMPSTAQSPPAALPEPYGPSCSHTAGSDRKKNVPVRCEGPASR